MKVTLTLAAAALAVLLSSAVNSKSVVREFSGSKGVTTVPFTVDGPWLLDWRLDTDYEQFAALDIVLIEAGTGRHMGGSCTLNTEATASNCLKMAAPINCVSVQRWRAGG